ncbi:alpha/beta hydrolase family protein [Kribbella amoyensis]|uniref:Alpha/beta hydrolase family protein n=2 Tax=Kribbella amoyensis TaxID=996641 RepID=A0A561BQJ8_9ACTN|nr:alpha/beta hydrolase family protein [Kribbella amoyensis]
MAVLSALAVVVSSCGVATRAQDAEPDGSVPGAGNPSKSPTGPIPAGLEKFYQQQPNWERCGRGQQCATVSVPLDYSKPTGDTIELSVRKVPARDQSAKVGTLFINPGGPGGSGVEFAAAAAFVLGAPLLRKFDVIGWDPRGVGQSTPVRCLDTAQLDKFIAADGSPDDEAEITELNQQAKTLADGCQQRSGKLLPHVSTKDAARDIDVLRGMVGDSELYYLGMSYGTYLGATYAELFPKNVGRLVLDGAVDPAKSAEENNIAQAKGFDTALDAFAEECAQRSCELGSTKQEVLAKVDKVIADTDANPLEGSGDRKVTQGLAVLGVIYPLYQKDFWPRLEEAIAQASEGKGARLLALADEYADRTPNGYSSNSNEVIYAVNCLDRQDIASVAEAKADEAKFKAASPRFGSYLLWGSLACANWPVKPEDKPHPIKAAGAKPIVVIGTTRDPATPYEWAVGLAKQLESGVLISRDGDGHTGYNEGNDCVDRAVETYLLQGTPPAADLKC